MSTFEGISLRARIYQSDPCALCFAFFLGAFFACTTMSALAEDVQGCPQGQLSTGISPTSPPAAREHAKPEGWKLVNSTYEAGVVSGAANDQAVVRSWLRAQFDLMDADKDGLLDRSDVTNVGKKMNLTVNYMSKLHSMVGDSEMSFQELSAVRGWIRTQFMMMDADSDGSLDAQDLARISRKMHLQPSFAAKFQKKAGSREMSFDEFKTIIQQMEHVAVSGKESSLTSPSSADQSILEESVTRATLLLGLMMLQSASAMVLGRYETLLKEHVIVMLFLTMLVGAGGNVGNQSVIKVIELLISGKLHMTRSECLAILWQQAAVGATLALILGVGGFARASVTQLCLRPPGEDRKLALYGCIAVATALVVIVLISAILGTVIPLALAVAGLDVAHAGPSIQVIMDIGGVIVTCMIARLILGQTRSQRRMLPSHKPT